MKTFTVYIYESAGVKPFTLDTNDPHIAYVKFLEAVDFLNPHSVRVHNNELKRDVFVFDADNWRERDKERKAQAVMRSCYANGRDM